MRLNESEYHEIRIKRADAKNDDASAVRAQSPAYGKAKSRDEIQRVGGEKMRDTQVAFFARPAVLAASGSGIDHLRLPALPTQASRLANYLDLVQFMSLLRRLPYQNGQS